MACLFFLMRFLEYKYFIRDISVELLIGFLALIFSALGIFLGWHLKRKGQTYNETAGLDQTLLQQKLPLSNREAEILVLMEKGYSNQEIADQLYISLSTVKSHISSIFQKLQVKRRTQAVKKVKATFFSDSSV